MGKNINGIFFFLLSFASLASGAGLTWTDNSANEDGFEIHRKEEAGPWLVIARTGPDVEAFTDSATRFGVLYTYRVRAFNSFGYSGYTNEAEHKAELAPIDEIPEGTAPESPGDTLTASRLASGLEAFALALRVSPTPNRD